MINSESLPIMTQTVANNTSLYNNYQPQNTRLTLEQQYQAMTNQMLSNQQQTQNLSSPYEDCLTLLNSCTDLTREKIYRDERFILIDAECENLLKQSLYSKVLNEVLNTQQGRISFEKRYTVAKSLKEEYTQNEIQKEKEFEQLKALMQDEEIQRVLQQRIAQAQNAPQAQQSVQTQQPIQTPAQSIQQPQIAQQTTQNVPQIQPTQTKQPTQQKQATYNKNQHPKLQSGGATE